MVSYKLYANPYLNVNVSAPSRLVINHALSFDTTPYFYYGFGGGGGGTLLGNAAYYGTEAVTLDTPATSSLYYTPSWNEVFMTGNVLKGTWKTHHNELVFGYWYEWQNMMQRGTVVAVDQATGNPANVWGGEHTITMNGGEAYSSKHNNTFTQTNGIFIGDTLKLLRDRMVISAGFKDVMVSRKGYNYVPGAPYNVNLNNNAPLPSFSFSYRFNRKHQIYITGTTNFRTPSNTTLFAVYSTSTGKISTAANANQKAEYSIEEEIGYRYTGDIFLADIAFFNYNFTNKQLSLNTLQNGAYVSQNVNAGGQTSRGVDLQLGTRPLFGGLRPYISAEYLHATIDNNIPSGADYLPTKGKTAIMSPKWQWGVGLDWDRGSYFASADIKYVGSQYSTFVNDERMPAYVTSNLSLGYRLNQIGFLKHPKIQLNLSNLGNSTIRNGVYKFSTNAHSVKGVFGTTISGSAPTYYLMPSFAALATFSTGF